MKKRVTIPLQENNNLVLSALHSLRNSLTMMNLDKNDEVQYAIFDLSGLMGIFSGEFKVTIEIDQDKMDSFASMFGVDFPQFADMEIVDINNEITAVVDEPKEEPYFNFLAYIEDDKLIFAVRSNVKFSDECYAEDDEFYVYNTIEPGDALVVIGTTFVAVPTTKGWVIVDDGVIVEEVEI